MFLILVLLRNPVVFVRAIFMALLGQGAYGDYLNWLTRGDWQSGVVREGIFHGLVYGDTSAQGWFGSRYTLAHNVARIELYRAGREYALVGNAGAYFWRKVFGPVTPGDSELHELAAVVNKVTGSISYAGLGIPRQQEALESLLVFPRYLRCSLGLLSDAIGGRVRGNESRRLISHLAVIAVAVCLIVLSI